MDHLKDDYGIELGRPLQVDYTARNFSHDIGPPRTKADFHTFPKQLGWQLDLDYKLDITSMSSEGTTILNPHNLDTLLTEWLFFGLIAVIVQKNGQPILKDEQLRSEGWLNTEALKPAIEEWAHWELENLPDLWARMIQAEYILEKARKVVRKNCGYDVERDRVEYHTNRAEKARYLTDQKAMALMTLGETLWQVKGSIMQEAEVKFPKPNVSLEGWHADDDDGWGPPRWVFVQMRLDSWCPRAVRLLKGQLRSNATLLLQAYYAYKGAESVSKRHSKCTKDRCEAKTLNTENEYSPLCIQDCQYYNVGGCQMVGPDMEEVRRILTAKEDNDFDQYVSDIPVLKFTDPDDGEGVKFEVTALSKREKSPFATVSHVWSDGWGNEKANSLHTCQLRFIRRQLQRLNKGSDVLFWMDTLLVPVKEDPMSEQEKEIKKKAIRQILDVFGHSTYTIVLDNGLCESDPPRELPTQTAMMILASGWMRRLWTLQEAFLSHKLHFVFQERRHELDQTAHLIDFDDLNEKLAQTQTIQRLDTLKFTPTGTVRGMLDRNIMGQERQMKKYSLRTGDQIQTKEAAVLVASAWFAARWRTTSNSAHETLALATLLKLEYEKTKIEEAGLTKREDMTDELLEDLVCDFWKTFHKTYRHAIPPGIIFLAGEKIKKTGFGWAPKTWMSAHEVDYPNPLDNWNGKTDLVDISGLRVKYPGFILHTLGKESRSQIVFMNQDPYIRFPADRNLIEWYNVKPADSTHHLDGPSFLPGIADRSTQLAIILPRPRPVASPPEIGLLVEIYRAEKNMINEDDGRTTRPVVFSCYIIRRVHVWREMLPKYLAGPDRNGPPLPVADRKIGTDTTRSHPWEIIDGSLPSLNSKGFCLGEAIPPEQPWLVDGYPHTGKPKSAGPQEGSTIHLDGEKTSKAVRPYTESQDSVETLAMGSTFWSLASHSLPVFQGLAGLFSPKKPPESESVKQTGALLLEAHKQKPPRRNLTYPARDDSSAAPSPTPGLPRRDTAW